MKRASINVEGIYRFFDKPVRREAALSGAVLLGVIGAFLFAIASVIHANLLNTSFYTRALDQNRAYDRVYEDVLADPELATEIGRSLNLSDPERSIAVSTLRALIPPQTLEKWSEEGLEAMVDYLAGDRDDLTPNVDLLALPLNRRAAVSTQLESDVANAPERRAESDAELITTLAMVRDAILRGRSPEIVPSGDTNPDTLPLVAAAILAPLNPAAREAIEEQVIGHLTADDIRGALAAAAPYLARFSAPDNGTGEGDDALARASGRMNGWIQQLVDGLGPLRNVIVRFGPWMLPLSIVSLASAWLLAGAAAHADAVRSTAAASGVVIMSAMVVGVFFLVAAPGLLDGQLEQATGGNAISSAPESVQALVGDIQGTLVSNMSSTGAEAMLWIGVAGAISTVIPLGIALGQRRGRVNMRHPLFVPVGAWALLILAMTAGPFALESSVEARAEPCNGHTELCSLRYDEVTYPGTHNAMSSSSDGWMFPYQDASMRSQLEDGVRVFLIDVHRWGSPDEYLLELDSIQNLSPQAREYLASLQGRFTNAPEGAFLCHATCWLGARPIDVALAEIRTFLENHPREVVTLILQDMIPSGEIVAAFERTELDELAHAQPADEEWPTLGKMIESGKRLVVFAENSGEPPAWFHSAWAYMWDTRFDFLSLSDLDCEVNRGSSENSLLLANHWIRKAVPDRSDATKMNSVPRLTDRVAECVDEHEKKPNFIAVDFYRIGELMRAVDEINGIGVLR